MKFYDLVELVGEWRPFETGLLLKGEVDPAGVRRQLSRWIKARQVVKLRRGLYVLGEPYQKHYPHPFLIANSMMPGSYVSVQSALGYYGLIPEYVPINMSMTTRRPAEWRTPLGVFVFRHLAPHLFYGYQQIELLGGQRALVALPEKALLDLVHLTAHGADPAYLSELRLQNLEILDRDRLQALAKQAAKPKWLAAARRIAVLIDEEKAAFVSS